MGYEPDEIEPMIEGLFLTRCDLDPPLEENEISNIARWFEGKPDDMATYSAYGTRFKDLRLGGDDSDSPWAYTGESIELGRTKFKVVALPWRDSASVIEYPDKVWWWGDRIPHPASLLKHGDAKAGKTDTTFALLDAAFREQAFLGEYATGFTPRILYLEEEGAPDVQLRLKTLGWTPEQCRSLSIDEVFGLDWTTLMASVIEEAVRDNRNLVIVDTLSMYLQLGASEQANLFSFAGSLKPLFAYAKRSGVSMWMLHHDNAGGKAYRRNEVTAQFDILLHHKFDEGSGIDEWVFDGRYFGKRKPEPIQYVWDKDSGARSLVTKAVAVNADPRTRNIQAVIEYLRQHPQGVKWAEVSEFLGNTPRGTVSEYLDLAVERVGGRKDVGGGRGNPSVWYPTKEPGTNELATEERRAESAETADFTSTTVTSGSLVER
jgi:hypothetical protein